MYVAGCQVRGVAGLHGAGCQARGVAEMRIQAGGWDVFGGVYDPSVDGASIPVGPRGDRIDFWGVGFSPRLVGGEW